MAISDWPGKVLWLTNTIVQVKDALKKHGDAIDKLKGDNILLSERLARLEERVEAREEVIVAKAGAAAGAAATQVTLASVSDIHRRIAVLEVQRGPRKLKPPE